MKLTTGSLKHWLPLSLIIVFIIAIWSSGLMDSINIEAIKEQRSYLLELVQTHPIISTIIFIGIYITSVALSLPIATLLTLLGGFLFGRWVGTAIVVISATTGATILFLIARSSLGAALRKKANPLYSKIATNMNSNAMSYMLFMRLTPIFPFFFVNIVPALFNIRLVAYVLTTFIGIIPGSFIYVNLGRELGSLNSLSDLISIQALIAFTLLGLFVLSPAIYKQYKNLHE